MTDETNLRELLAGFVSGADRSKRVAGDIEVLLDRLFPEDERFEELLHALASYEPGGGEFMYDEQDIARLSKHAMRQLGSIG